jgi:hypothetical protein
MRREEAASSSGQDAAPSRLIWEFDSPRCYQVMNAQAIELDGLKLSSHRSSIVSAAEITASWWSVRGVIAADSTLNPDTGVRIAPRQPVL